MYKNHIDLIGFIGSDPEARQTSNGTAVTTFSLATKSSWKNESGAYDSRTEWHRIVLWGKLADAAAKLAKGAYVEVEGELRHRSYQKEIPAAKKAVTVNSPVTEVHARILRKLDRSATSVDSEITEEAPEWGALSPLDRNLSSSPDQYFRNCPLLPITRFTDLQDPIPW